MRYNNHVTPRGGRAMRRFLVAVIVLVLNSYAFYIKRRVLIQSNAVMDRTRSGLV